jgi:hypothetical protein
MITMNLILKPEPMRSLIQIPVSLEILISCFLRSVEVCFSQWANQPRLTPRNTKPSSVEW